MSMKEVPRIGLAKLEDAQVKANEKLIERMEGILERVRKGELVDGIFVGHDPEGSITIQMATALKGRLLGAMDIAKASIIKGILG